MRNLVNDLIHTYKLNGLGLKRADESAILGNLAEPERLTDALSRRLAEIAEDRRLTADGRADAARTAGRETLAALEEWHAPKRDGLERQEHAIRAEMAASVTRPRSSAMEDALLRGEIRRAAADLTDLQTETLFRQGDALVRDALSEVGRIVVRNGAVSLRPYISPETRDAVLLDAAQQARPDLADALHDVRETGAVYASVAAAVRRIVANAAPGAIERPAPRILA